VGAGGVERPARSPVTVGRQGLGAPPRRVARWVAGCCVLRAGVRWRRCAYAGCGVRGAAVRGAWERADVDEVEGWRISAYIVRVPSWASIGLNVWGPQWSSMGEFKNLSQTRNRNPKPQTRNLPIFTPSPIRCPSLLQMLRGHDFAWFGLWLWRTPEG
jgi:hypothetical protein